MAYKIVYTKQATLNESGTETCGGSATKLILTVTSVEDFADTGLFVYTVNPITLAQQYSHVATPCDLQTYAFESAGDKDSLRLSTVTLIFATAELADTALASIEASFADLVDDMTALDTLGTVQTSTIV